MADRKPGSRGPIPVNDVGFLSYTTIGWLTPLVLNIFKDRKKEIREEDVWTCSKLESCDVNTERLETMWFDETQTYGREKCSVLRVWLKFIWIRLMVAFTARCFKACITFLSTGYIVRAIAQYLEGPESSISYAIGLVICTIVGQFLRTCSHTYILVYGTQTGLRFRSGILGMVYRKLLKLKKMNGKIASEVITIFGSDALRLSMNTNLFVYILSMPVSQIIGTAYLHYLIGVWCFIAFAILFVSYLFQVLLMKIISILRRRTLEWTDIRIRKINEVLASMKLIKMYVWKNVFQRSITDIRKTESRPILHSTILNLVSNAIISLTPSLSTVATIAMYSYAGNELTASTCFSVVATLNFMWNAFINVPFAFRVFGETMISFERIKRFMLEEECKIPGQDVIDSENSIEFRDSVFMRDNENSNSDNNKSDELNCNSSRTSSVLRIPNLTVEKEKLLKKLSKFQGKHIGICGTLGSGKSSLLQALIGRISLHSGHLAVSGSIAYTEQQAWVFNGTIRENILFGKPYKQDWYTKVLHSCSLDSDILLLANGDMSEIGDKGINLSGGQKQRLSLARAVYSNSDIYLLDDQLSAVDVHVRQHLFRNCIDNVLKDKTIVLVTHQLEYLKHCDEIYVMDEGAIVESGNHESLLTRDGLYTRLMEKFNTAHTGTTDDEAERDGDQEDVIDMTTNQQQNTRMIDHHYNYEKGILTDREKAKTDSISVDVYMSYIRAAGGKLVAAFVILTYVCFMSSVIFSDWWLGLWIEDTTSPEQTKLRSESNTGSNVSTPGNVTETSSREIELEKTVWFTVYVYSVVGITMLVILRATIAGLVMIKASVNLHNNAVGRVMSAPMQFFDANPPGRIINRFSRDIENADLFIPFTLDSLLRVLILVLAYFISIVYNFPLYLIAVFSAGFYFYHINNIASVSIRNFERLENIVRSLLISHVTTTCNGLIAINIYGQEKNLMNRCIHRSDTTTMGMMLYHACVRWMGLRIDIGGSMLTIITTIVVLATKGSISPALSALSLTLSISGASLIQYLTRSVNETEAKFTAIERIHEYENLKIEEDTGCMQVDNNWPDQGRIVFSNVIMKYRMDMDPVLRNISFDILPKQKVGIVGRTGAGKSSLVSALFRLTDLSGGHVFIDDVEIGTVSRDKLRTKLSSIPQDPVLFAGTLRYNLDPFEKFTDAELWTALEHVRIKEKMNLLGQTLELRIEENGENFSVGERQLICLARAILRKNKILVLDEATASIDTSTDAMLQETIRESFADCTVLMIAHRLNTVLHCDVILVMEGGRVIERGNPQTLMGNPSSHFSNMIRAQTVLSQHA